MIPSGKENRSPFTGVVKRTGVECRDFGRKKKKCLDSKCGLFST